MRAIAALKFRAMILVFLSGAAGGFVYGGSVFHGGPQVHYVMREPSRAEILVRAHDCWTRKAPADMAGKLPGHVVVTTPSGDTIYGGDYYVGKALDQAFGHHNYHLTIRGFCR